MFVILDRDGVINYESNEYVRSPEAWDPIPGSLEAIARLKKAGNQVIIATNQSGIGRGYFTEATLARIHKKMNDMLQEEHGVALDGIYYCPHHPDEGCACRKPKPGMLLAISRDFKVDLSDVPFVGDSWRDIEAARAARCRPILVRTGRGEDTLMAHQDEVKDQEIYAGLAAYVDALLV